MSWKSEHKTEDSLPPFVGLQVVGGCAILLILATALIIGLVASWREAAKLWHNPDLVAASEVALGGAEVDRSVLQSEGFESSENGLYLAPGQAGILIYQLHVAKPGPLAVEPVFYNIIGSKRFRNRISYSLDGGVSFVTVGENRSYLRGQAVTIPIGASQLLLRFDAANTTDERALVLQGFRYRAAIELDPVPHLSPLLYGMALVMAVLCLVDLAEVWHCLMILTCPWLVLLGVYFPGGSAVLTLILMALSISRQLYRQVWMGWLWERAAILLILGWGLALREAKLEEYAYAPLAGDAGGYRQIAQEMSLFSWTDGFYAPRWREPLYPLVAKMFFMATGKTELHLRLLSVYAGVAALLLAWRVGRKLFHPVAGLLAALLMATDRYLILRSMYGYRLEVETFLLLLFMLFFYSDRRPLSWIQSVAAGLTAGLLALANLSFIPMAVLLLAVFSAVHRSRWKRVGWLASVVAVLLLTPLLVRQASKFGDPLHPLTLHAKWYRNLEAQKNVGRPGYPPAEQIGEYTGYGGPDVTLLGYLWGQHTGRQLWDGAAEGYKRYLSGEPFFRDPVLRILFGLGIALTLILPNRRMAGLLILLANMPPVLFLYGTGLLTEERVLLHAYPFAAICVSVPFLTLLRRGEGPRDEGGTDEKVVVIDE
ncbi:MAG: glycosyltransferase family 39 protein [Planctomycetes bacterium]|nr:glycosyltransferase family 39 protein [Planctomycetota bacterium]